jgi:endonuclease G
MGASTPSVVNDHLLLGNPDGATVNPAQADRYLVLRSGFVASYNNTLRYPNWVSWRLSKADIGDIDRGNFTPDKGLPEGFVQVTPSDYTGSGYDRGHNCPSKDRTRTREDNDGVFLMTNITPQTHDMNAGPWEDLESDCRKLAQAGNELYIVCGHGQSGTYQTIGKNKVAVPQWGWKVVIALPEKGGDDKARMAQAQVIAIRVPNTRGILSDEWTKYATTPAQIEQATGLRFFTDLAPEVAQTLRIRTASSPPTKGADSGTTGKKPTGDKNGAGMVWVNTKSGAYWKPGTRYFGKTKQGKFMRESEAIKAGHHPAEP